MELQELRPIKGQEGDAHDAACKADQGSGGRRTRCRLQEESRGGSAAKGGGFEEHEAQGGQLRWSPR